MRTVFVFLALLLISLSTTAYGLDDDVSESQREAMVVHAAYDALERYAEWPTQDLSFELSYFETFTPDQFDEVLYVDLATLPEGEVVTITRSTRNLDASDVFFRHYIPRWDVSGANWRNAPEAQRMLAMTVAEVFAEAGRQDPELASVERITRYRVTVRLAGKSLDYRAAFLWLPAGSQPHELRFRALDHITQGVAEAAGEDLPTIEGARRILRQRETQEPVRDLYGNSESPLPSVHDPSAPSSDPGAPAGEESHGVVGVTAASITSCRSQTTPYSTHDGHSGTGGHLSGSHFSHADFSIECTCGSSCTSACSATLAGGTATCDDTGTYWDACHHMADSNNSSTDFQGNGTSSGAACGVGFGCVKKSCLFCGCGVSVSVSAVKSSVSFTTSGGPDWQGNAKATATCPLCVQEQGCPEPLTVRSSSSIRAALNNCTGTDPQASDPDSPIVIDLAGDGFRFTSADEGVLFDLDADGTAERVAWTTAGSDDAFLVTDWNQNGIVDHGRELFGNHSAQLEPPPGEGRNGYNALRWYDEEAGGNDDGWISADDAWFSDFWLWLDDNHNGISEPQELFTLPAFGIERIDLDFVESRRRDGHGNLLRYTSPVIVGSGPNRLLPGHRSRTTATDVFLVKAEN